nr:glycoside hydrolase family 15 protein [Tersicoccus phoenicis]
MTKAQHEQTAETPSLSSVQTLRNYALLADGERGALVGPNGDIAWLCVPRWDDAAIFSSLIGGSGFYTVAPTGVRFVHGGQYEDGTLIWRSRWVTEQGVVECRQALALPADQDRAILLRRIYLLSGSVPVRVLLQGRPDFGAHTMLWSRTDDGMWTATGGGLSLRVRGLESATVEDGSLLQDFDPVPGAYYDVVVEIAKGKLPQVDLDASALWRATEHEWADCVPAMHGSIAPDDARQSWAILQGMTSSTGAMVAAATMSLPERAEAKRNYDYRYAWIRDQCFVGQAASAAGMVGLLDDAIRFTSERILTDGDRLKPAYTVLGGRVPDESSLDLPGYPGGSDLLGNWVNEQFQLDNFGECLLLMAEGARHDRLDVEHWRAVEQSVRAIEKRWQEPDAGIWELHNEKWTHSRLICVAGLRAIARHAPGPDAARWEGLADTILAATATTSVHPSGRWQRSPEDERVDAALLLAAIRGAVPPEDPRTVGDRRRHPRRTPGPGLRLPVPARQASPGRGGGRVPAVRFQHGAGRAPAEQRPGGLPPVRAEPGRVRLPGPVHRGVRRRTTATAGEPAASVRPRGHGRDLLSAGLHGRGVRDVTTQSPTASRPRRTISGSGAKTTDVSLSS